MRIKFGWFLILIVLVGSLGMVHAQNDEHVEVYYICFDNSWSMKRYEFYHRLIGALMTGLKREGLYQNTQIKYVPFGTRGDVSVLDDYSEFAGFINKNTFATTDFVKLGEALKEVSSQDKVIIISDGEHDISRDTPFTNLTTTELKQMLAVVKQLKEQNVSVSCIHILKQHGNASISGNLQSYYNQMESRSGSTLPGMETVITQGGTIAALSKDFMKKLAKTTDNYFFCTENQDAVRALMKIFNISKSFYTDASRFLIQIPIYTEFIFVDRSYKSWFKEELEGYDDFCINDVKRRLKIHETTGKADFNLTIEYIRANVYNVTLGGETPWRRGRISNSSEMGKCILSIVASLKALIEADFSNDPRFVVPESLISIKFADEKLYSFLTRDNFKLRRQTCTGINDEPAKVDFFDKDNRVYVSMPIWSADKLNITVPGQEDNIESGKTISINKGITNSWDSEELIVREKDLGYPTFSVNFSTFLSAYPGTLLFFSASTKRFFAMAKDNRYQCNIELLKDRQYWIYFVPQNIKEKIIKFYQKTLSTESDVMNALELLKPTDIDVVYAYWEDWLKEFSNAKNNISEKSTDLVARQIVQSNGYFLLLQHLGEIKQDPAKRVIFKEILDETINLYDSTDSPFKVIDLMETKINGFSEDLRDKYLRSGQSEKIKIIIRLLSKPIFSLKELRGYLDGKRVSEQNTLYFSQLEK